MIAARRRSSLRRMVACEPTRACVSVCDCNLHGGMTNERLNAPIYWLYSPKPICDKIYSVERAHMFAFAVRVRV